MARIFITGSADGLGMLAAKALTAQGHQVVLHARNEKRAREASENVPGADTALAADLDSIDETIELADKVNALGTFDAIIHNAGVYQVSARELFNVNTLAPFILTCLIQKPKRLIYLSSDMQAGGSSKLDFFISGINRMTYSDTKLHVVMLCKAVARRWKDVYANALDPGWVPTKMGGANAPESFESGYQTQVWLATSDDEKAKVSGRFFYHRKEIRPNPEADDVECQDRFITLCEEITGVQMNIPSKV